MAGKRHLGIFLANETLSIVETEKSIITNFFDASKSFMDDSRQPFGRAIPDEIKLTAVIQKFLRDRKIEAANCFLSLSTQDVIMRSFFIPSMTPSEIKGVVDFEARRYVPFQLDELIYSYHALTETEKKIRRIRIFFVAIKRDIIEKYCSILVQAGLKIISIEPAPISLLRILTFRRFIQRHQKLAVIQFTKAEGTIVVIDRNIPRFVRDFRFASPTFEAPHLSTEDFKTRLINEVRISLDYYRRQQPTVEINKVLFVSTLEASDLALAFQGELGIQATALNMQSLLNIDEETDLGVLYAFGAALKDTVPFPVHIDLLKARNIPMKAEKQAAVAIDYSRTFKFAFACALAISIIFILAKFRLSLLERKIADLNRRQGSYQSLSVEELARKQREAYDRIEAFKKVRLKSNVAYFLNRIPNLLPQGTWLTKLNINYSDMLPAYGQRRTNDRLSSDSASTTMISVHMDGYAFADDVNQQINQINQFLKNIKTDAAFAKTFSSVNLVSANRQVINDYTVTYFQVTCQ